MKKNVFAKKGTVVGNTFMMLQNMCDEDRTEFDKYYGFYNGRLNAGAGRSADWRSTKKRLLRLL